MYRYRTGNVAMHVPVYPFRYRSYLPKVGTAAVSDPAVHSGIDADPGSESDPAFTALLYPFCTGSYSGSLL